MLKMDIRRSNMRLRIVLHDVLNAAPSHACQNLALSIFAVSESALTRRVMGAFGNFACPSVGQDTKAFWD